MVNADDMMIKTPVCPSLPVVDCAGRDKDQRQKHGNADDRAPQHLEDEIVRETLLTRGGEIVQARVREFFKLPALVKQG